jgi:hypothetical protein
MSGEIFPSPENLIASQFVDFVESHAQIILDTSEESLADRDITRRSDWMLADTSQLVPIDTVRFQVIIDLGDPSLFHEIIFLYQGENVFFVGYDAHSQAFTATIGEGQEDTELSNTQVKQLLDQLAFHELSGSLTNTDHHLP